MRLALNSNINTPVLEYLEAKLEDTKNNLVDCGEGVYKVVQGRAIELRELIKIVKSSRENK